MQLMNFLLVEDDDGFAEIMLRTFEQHRIANLITRMRDGEQALAYLRQQPPYAGCAAPDIVFLDIGLPKVDGLAVLSEIRGDPRLEHVPVVIMTGSAAESDRARACDQRANSYLVKPRDAESLRRTVLDLCLSWGIWNHPPP